MSRLEVCFDPLEKRGGIGNPGIEGDAQLEALSGLSHKFLYFFIVPVQPLPRIRLREFPLDGRLVLIALRRPGEHFTA